MEQSEFDLKAKYNSKLAIAIRAGRSALGWNQAMLAKQAGIAKTTLSRFENLELSVKADTFLAMATAISKAGVVVDVTSNEDISIRITEKNWLEQGEQMWEKFYGDISEAGEDEDPPSKAFLND